MFCKVLSFTFLLCVLAGPARALPPMAQPVDAQTLCKTIAEEAQRRGLPQSYFARLISKESLFDAHAVSPKGAQGIAQFMPETAKDRGLANPFSPIAALKASAELLLDLKTTFGNLGLAAAAYNAGAERVQDWLQGRRDLPAETLNYVQSITGRPAADWVPRDASHSVPAIGAGNFMAECIKLASRQIFPSSAPAESAQQAGGPPQIREASTQAPLAPERKEQPIIPKPWGVQLAGAPSQTVALKMFEAIRARHRDLLGTSTAMVIWKRNPGMGPKPMANVRIGTATRQEAENFCSRLLATGIACVALRN